MGPRHRHCKITWPEYSPFCPPTVALTPVGERWKIAWKFFDDLWRLVLTWPSTWWLIVFPEKQGPGGREKFTFVDFGGGDRCRRHLSDLTVTGEVKTLDKYFLCFKPNLYTVFWPGKSVDKPTLVGLSVGVSVYRRYFPDRLTSVSLVSVSRSERRFIGGVSYTQSSEVPVSVYRSGRRFVGGVSWACRFIGGVSWPAWKPCTG